MVLDPIASGIKTDSSHLTSSRATGHTELKTLQQYANLRSAILASKLDGVGMPSLA